MVALAKIPVRMTVTEFLAWDSGDDTKYELVDGEPRAMAPATAIHGLLQTELGRLIGNHFRNRNSNCEIVTNPGIISRLLSAHNMRIPDLAVTCAPLMPGQSALPDPVVLIDILSPSNHAETWANVWTYTSIPTVQEILVLRTDRIGAEILRRLPEGEWPEHTETVSDGEIRLTSIGFGVSIAELYARTRLVA